MELKELHDQMQTTFASFKEVNDRLEAEVTKLGAEVPTTRDALDKLEKQISDLEVKLSRPGFGSEADERAESKMIQGAFETYLRKGEKALSDEQKASFENFAPWAKKALASDE